MRIAIGFYGITRSLKHTAGSIHRNVLEPARRAGEVTVFCHFYVQQMIDNPRTGEYGSLDPDEWKLLAPDHCGLEPAGSQREVELFTQLQGFGNAWEDDGQSLRNIIRQLTSLQKVSQMIRKTSDFDLVVYLRADMEYHDVFDFPAIFRSMDRNTVMVPNWAWGGGLNDRFAIGGSRAHAVYANRIERALDYCQRLNKPLHSERLLMYALGRDCVRLQTMPIRATRIRLGGSPSEEFFSPVKWPKRLQAFLNINLRNLWCLVLDRFRQD